MIPGLTKPLRHCTPSDLLRHSEDRAVRLSQSNRLYTVGLLEEAYQLTKSMSMAKAAKLSGVNKNSLSHFIQAKRLSEGHVTNPRHNPKGIPAHKKLACFKLAMALHKRRFSKSMRKCWIEAGKRTGIVGRSVEFQYVRGLWKPPL